MIKSTLTLNYTHIYPCTALNKHSKILDFFSLTRHRGYFLWALQKKTWRKIRALCIHAADAFSSSKSGIYKLNFPTEARRRQTVNSVEVELSFQGLSN